jgi:uncharacterized protein (TIGR03000 family)
MEKPKDKEETAKVKLTAPADVRILVDGRELPRRGTSEELETPALERGRNYAYVFRAEVMRDGQMVVREEKVFVRAGEVSEVNFSNMGTRATASTPALKESPPAQAARR